MHTYKQVAFVTLILFFVFIEEASAVGHSADEWGVSAVTLGRPTTGLHFLDMLNARSSVLIFDEFYGIGGSLDAISPTICKVTHSKDTLYVLFHCVESEMNFPWPDVSQDAKWHNLLNTPPEQDAAFPDKIDFFLQPNFSKKSYYQFCATINGEKFGAKCDYELSKRGVKKNFEPVSDFKTSIIKTEKEWIVFLRIPWKTVGGIPEEHFGIIPVRTKWRNSEVTSPVAMGYSDRPSVDLFIESTFGNTYKIHSTEGALCRLPSGTYRWQRLLSASYPDLKIKEKIWDLQQSLHFPTSKKNIENRLYLLNYWVNLMEAEGFNFGSTRGSLPEIDIYPSDIRVKVNNHLVLDNFTLAAEELDLYLSKLDHVTRKWFADNSTGNILSERWSEIQSLIDIKECDSTIVLKCKTNRKDIELIFSFPSGGGIRLNTGNQGFFSPNSLSGFTSRNNGSLYIAENENDQIVISKDPFEIIFENLENKSRIHIQGKDISFLFDDENQVIASDIRTDLNDYEAIYGFGEKFDRFNQKDNVLTIWGVDDWEGLTTGLQNQSYKAIPVFHSTRNYMVFVNSTYRLRVDIGKTGQNELRLTLHGDIFDYYIWLSNPEQAVKSYTDITGNPILPPKWAFEPWMGRKGTAWNAPFKDPVKEQLRVMNEFEKLQIPHSAIYAEGSGADTPALYRFTYPRNIKVLSWSYSEIRERDQRRLLPDVSSDSLPLLRVDNPNNLDSRNISYVDFTHPNAKPLLRAWWKRRLDLGLAGSMVDFGDRVPEDVTFFDGRTGAQMHNFYSYDYHKTVHDVFKERRGDDFILFGRSAAPGTQKWVAQFSGDLRSNFKGLIGALHGLLNLSASGFSTIGSDLGGFRGTSEPNVYIRWTQLSCFSPLMRAHGRSPREPWEYGESAIENYKFYAWVRYNLLDYIYNAAIEANETGMPIVRPMSLSYPDDYRSDNKSFHQYMFGENVMVSPIISDNDSKNIYFPKGSWTNLWNGELVVGPTEVSKEFSLMEIPVYIKEESILPVQLNEKLRMGESLHNNMVDALIITPFKNSKSIAFVKDDKNIDVNVVVNETDNSLDISINNYPELLYLLVYHDMIKTIEVNGDEIPELKSEEGMTDSIGWVSDISLNRTNIRLPYSKEQHIKIFLEK